MDRKHSYFAVVACLCLALATLAVYSRSARNPFLHVDDQNYVTENPHVQAGLTWQTFTWAFGATAAQNWHPLTWLSHALDCQLYGLNPVGHHSTNIVLHAFNAVLLFLLLSRGTGAMGRSLLVAALFALHPLNVESVAWIAERKNVLSTLFFLLTLGAYGWYALKPGIERYLAVVGLFALALASKPMVVTLPFVLLLVDFWPLQRMRSWQTPSATFPAQQTSLGQLVLEKIPLLLMSAASSVITVMAQGGAIAAPKNLPLSLRLPNALYANVMYLVKTLWPTHLAAYYPYAGTRLALWQSGLCALALLAITALVWRKRSHYYLLVGWLWYLGTLVPVNGLFLQVGDQSMADRYAYLPLIGIFCMLVWGAGELAERQKLGLRECAIAGCAVVLVLAIFTWRQIGFWDSSFDLWTHALNVTTNNYMAEDYVGTSLLMDNYNSTGQRYSDEALVHFQNAVRIEPRDAISHLNLGAGLHEHRRFQEAIQQYQAALSLTPDEHLIVKCLIDIGAAYQQLGDYAKAEEYDKKVLALEPRNKVVLMNLGKVAMGERAQQMAADAAAHPTPLAFFQLGQLQQYLGSIADARASYQRALQMKPDYSDAQGALASLDQPATPQPASLTPR